MKEIPLEIQLTPKQFKAINNLFVRSGSKLQPNDFILALIGGGMNKFNEKLMEKENVRTNNTVL